MMSVMLKELRKHPFQYLALSLLVAVHAYTFVYFWPNKQAQEVIAASLGGTYFLWGMIHHALGKSLHRRVVLEYFFVSIFASAVLIMLVE